MVFFVCAFLSLGKNKLEYNKDYFGRLCTHSAALGVHVVLIGTKYKQGQRWIMKFTSILVSSPASNHHPSVARELI